MVKIKHRNVGGTGIGDVGAVAVRRDIDEVRASVDADGGDDFILLGVDHADVRRSRVHHIHFVALGIRRNARGFSPNRQSANRPKAAQVNDGYCVALTIGNICVFAVERAVAGESALVEVVPAGGEDERDEDGDEKKFSQMAVPC